MALSGYSIFPPQLHSMNIDIVTKGFAYKIQSEPPIKGSFHLLTRIFSSQYVYENVLHVFIYCVCTFNDKMQFLSFFSIFKPIMCHAFIHMMIKWNIWAKRNSFSCLNNTACMYVETDKSHIPLTDTKKALRTKITEKRYIQREKFQFKWNSFVVPKQWRINLKHSYFSITDSSCEYLKLITFSFSTQKMTWSMMKCGWYVHASKRMENFILFFFFIVNKHTKVSLRVVA